MPDWVRVTCERCNASVLRVEVPVAMLWAERHLAREHPGESAWFSARVVADPQLDPVEAR